LTVTYILAMTMDTMTTGKNSESWCKSKKDLNMTALVNRPDIEPVTCAAQAILFNWMYNNEPDRVVANLIARDVYKYDLTSLCG
jgi:hypothetical protein